MFSLQKCLLNYPTWSYSTLYAYIHFNPLLFGIHVDKYSQLSNISSLFLPSYVEFKFSPIFCSPVSMGNILLYVKGMAAFNMYVGFLSFKGRVFLPMC